MSEVLTLSADKPPENPRPARTGGAPLTPLRGEATRPGLATGRTDWQLMRLYSEVFNMSEVLTLSADKPPENPRPARTGGAPLTPLRGEATRPGLATGRTDWPLTHHYAEVLSGEFGAPAPAGGCPARPLCSGLAAVSAHEPLPFVAFAPGVALRSS